MSQYSNYIKTANTLNIIRKKTSTSHTDFYRYIHIWSWTISNVKVKVVYISTGYMSETVTDRAHVVIANRYDVTYSLSIGILTVDLDPMGQGQAHIDREYLSNGNGQS